MNIIIFIVLSFFLVLSSNGEEIKLIHLNYVKEKSDSIEYALQIQTNFKQLLSSDSDLAKMFHKFEAPPTEGQNGRYNGEPSIQAITLKESENVNFKDSGGEKSFEKSIALYYRFDEGMHRGRETRSGFFALFVVQGTILYRPLKDGEFEMIEPKVVAIFKGFSRTIISPEPVDE